MIQRHSSRRQPLDAALLTARLANAKGYDRIAGYFSSSILEVAGEALETVQGQIRVVCNSQLSRVDVDVAKLAGAAMRREWCESRPEALGENARPRSQWLYDFLRSGKLEIRVLPDDVFGLIHSKAGVVTLADGRRTAFLGSTNECRKRWTRCLGCRRRFGPGGCGWTNAASNIPGVGTEAIRHCPQRIGIVSTSAITSNSDVVAHLEAMRFECVILDEAHRAHRRRVSQRPYAAA